MRNYRNVTNVLKEHGFSYQKPLKGSHQPWMKHGENGEFERRVEVNIPHNSYQMMLECGHKEAWENKNAVSVSKIEKPMNQFLPAVLVLQDVDAANARRAVRIRALDKQVVGLAEKHQCKVTLFSGRQLRMTLLGDAEGTKHEMAEMLAQKYPVELAGKMPRKRCA